MRAPTLVAVAASAVTQTEYLFAYLIPFIVAGVILHPMPHGSIAYSGLIIGHINNLIHTPWMEEVSEKLVPWFGVSTANHFHHHRHLNTHYAAPTISVDRLLAAVFGKPESWGKEFKED